MIRSIEHMAIAAKQTGALAQWYIDTLGFRVVVDGGPTGTWFIGPPEGESLIEIIKATDAPPHERARNDPGWSHLAFTVEDFDKAIEDLTAKGVTFTNPPSMSGGGDRLAFFLDGDGNVLQIVSRPQPLA
jgi:catechol 2,3-dioxygenase-like lactoylglutathione lyase family enzyme